MAQQLSDGRVHPVSHDISASRDGEIAQLKQAVTTLVHRLDLVESLIRDLSTEWKDARRHGWLTRKDA